jgi:hypothetical protein
MLVAVGFASVVGVAAALAVGDVGAVGVVVPVGVGETVAVTRGRNVAFGPEVAAIVKPGVGEGCAVTDGTGDGTVPPQALPTARITKITSSWLLWARARFTLSTDRIGMFEHRTILLSK